MLNARIQDLEQSRAELRERAGQAERDLAGAQAELGRLRAAGEARPEASGRARRRTGPQPGGETAR